jgi:hypothetical protein
MAGFKTIKVLINDDGTVEFDQVGWTGKKCANDIQSLIDAMGEEKSVQKKDEYYKDNKVQIQQRF